MKSNGYSQNLNMECDLKIIINEKVFIMCVDEFYENKNTNSFDVFINTEYELGLSVVNLINDMYKIVDEKKWVLARLKYGI